MTNPMLELARSEGHRPKLPYIQPPLEAISGLALRILRLSAREGGVKRTKELPALLDVPSQYIGNPASKLQTRYLIAITGEKHRQVFHATEAGLEELERANV